MPPRADTLRYRMLLVMVVVVVCVPFFSRGVLAENGGNTAQTPSNSTDGKGTSAGPTPAPVPATTTSTPRPAPPCVMVAVYPVRDQLQSMLLQGAKLIELDLSLQGYPEDYLELYLKSVFKPSHWVRSTGRQGRSLLVLEDNYDFMSLFFLSIGVFEQNVTITDSPQGCLRRLSPEKTLEAIQLLILNDFQAQTQGQAQGQGSLSVDEHVCHMVIGDDDGSADFHYKCCRYGPDKNVICSDINTDDWIGILMAFIVIAKVLVVLFSPSFLPGSMYRLKYVAAEYIYPLPQTSRAKTLRVVVTQYPASYGNEDKVAKLSEMKGMEYFKTMVDTHMQLDRIYQVTFDRIRLSVKSRRLLGENYVPVGLLTVLYRNLLRCRIRKLDSLKDCCEANILGRLNPGVSCPNWATVCRGLAKVLLLTILVLPWVLRIWVFFSFEQGTVMAKTQAAERMGLKTSFRGSLTLYLSPLHGLFVIMYIILIVDSVIYGVLSKRWKEHFKMVLRKCLRDMRERSRITVCGWTTWVLVMPFRIFGVLGLLLFPIYLLLVLPVLVPVVAFYLFPALNLTVRLIIHFFLFLCPTKIMEKWTLFTERFSRVREHLDLNKVTADESFDEGQKMSRRDMVIQVVVILMVLVSFWSLTFLLMEMVSFVVEMGIYTLMGIIVNAAKVLQYITVLIMVMMYGRTCFNDVHKTYLVYHQKIHKLLLDMKREEIDDIARQEAMDQENTAFRVPGENGTPTIGPDVQLVVKAGRPQWKTSSMLMFLDRLDTPFTPEKFFYDVITLGYCGAPGQLYKHFLKAFWNFFQILLFLFFVFVVVMAFGDAYSVSSTNRLLATVAGGFIPFLFRFVFSAAGGVPSLYTDSVQFRTQFDTAINKYTQNWPVHDIIPTQFGEFNPRDSIILNSTPVTQPPDAPEDSTDIRLEMEDEDDEGGVDMIVDVSTAETRRRGYPGLREAGSASMLAPQSFNSSISGGGDGGSARIYKPRASAERAIDV